MKKYTNHSSTAATNTKKQILVALLLAGVVHLEAAQAAVVNNGDQLTISNATYDATGYVSSGSWFGMDLNVSGTITLPEIIGMKMGINGIIIGLTSVPGSHHFGAQTTSDTGPLDGSWQFNGSTGSSWLNGIPVTGDTTSGLNLNGWTWA